MFEITSDEEINESEYTRRLELQLVPQLLPYVRSTLTTLSALLSMQPVVLPTMDVMRSIQKNRQSKLVLNGWISEIISFAPSLKKWQNLSVTIKNIWFICLTLLEIQRIGLYLIIRKIFTDISIHFAP